MEERKFTAEIEVSRKSLFLILQDIQTGREQVLPLAEVKPSSSLCFQYDIWEHALDNLDLEEMPIENKQKLQSQIERLYDQIHAHQEMPCDCEEDSSTRYFRGFSIESSRGSYWLTIMVYENMTQTTREFEVAEFSSIKDMVLGITEIFEYAQKHRSFSGFEMVDLSEIDHRVIDVVLAAGEALENWKFEQETELGDEILVLLDRAEKKLEQTLNYLESNPI
ncbi:MAG: hypothetical protein D6732_11575 [Methanobacteriota archaeon]|nr:MAG: hypothetical protein D6732_11575 [Euryarchaeota archaeon]